MGALRWIGHRDRLSGAAGGLGGCGAL